LGGVLAQVSADVSPSLLETVLLDAYKTKQYGPKPAWVKKTKPGSDIAAAQQVSGLMHLALDVWDWLEAEMERRQEFDFTYLEAKAVQLVEKCPDVIDKLRTRYRAVLIDEAQDVNPVQYRLIDSLGLSSEMMVGDPQQSIYGFRQADRELFINRASELPSLQLSKNHRSDEGILRFVDHLFGQLWAAEYMPMLGIKASEDDPFGEDPGGDFDGVEFWPMPGVDRGGTALRVQELISDGWRAGQIAVLTRKNEFAHQVASLLTDLGIDTRIVGGSERFFTRLEVRDLANVLTTLADPTSDFALIAVLMSPFVGVTLDTAVLLAKAKPVADALDGFVSPLEEDNSKLEVFKSWFFGLQKYADRLPAWETISAVLNRSPYLESIALRPNAQQTLANVRKLLSMATQLPELGPMAFADRIREIRELRHKEGDAPTVDDDADAVTLMTIHKAKGLEFDVVVLPETHVALTPRGREIMVNARSGVITTKFGHEASFYHNWQEAQFKDREREESLRLLYVAMTRARKRLCLAVDPSRQDSKASGLIWSRTAKPGESPPGVLVRGEPEDA
jgi:ATP-dependent exoDNAse (exonuclease V) beta subunit